MIYEKAKIYSDGSHYIAVPHSTRFNTRKRKVLHKEIIVDENLKEVKDAFEPVTITTPKGEILTESEFICGELVPVTRKVKAKGTRTTKKAVFEKLYKEHIFEKRKVMRKKIISAMAGLFENASDAENYVDGNLERKRRNLICRRVRLTRKVNLQTFDYFCTFTYDDKKHTEISFRKKLTWTFANLSHRKGWKYVGVWERSPEKKRLHFHGILYIPDNAMVGELKNVNDYSLKTRRRQTTVQNTYFNEKFGRSDFEKIKDNRTMSEAVAYILKYIEKSGERIVYSRGLPQYFISDVMSGDVVTRIGQEDKKLLLYDDFNCIDDGCVIGKVGTDTIKQMPKCN